MSDDLYLFGEDAPSATPVGTAVVPIAEWQIDLLRRALDAQGRTTMAERQAAIETAVGHSVGSLRELSHDEALRLLSAMNQGAKDKERDGSAWDQRDEDTWIDRL